MERGTVWRGSVPTPLGRHSAFSKVWKVGRRWFHGEIASDCHSGNAGVVVSMGEGRAKDIHWREGFIWELFAYPMREDELQQGACVAEQDEIPEDTLMPGTQGGRGRPCRGTVENGGCSTGKFQEGQPGFLSATESPSKAGTETILFNLSSGRSLVTSVTAGLGEW